MRITTTAGSLLALSALVAACGGGGATPAPSVAASVAASEAPSSAASEAPSASASGAAEGTVVNVATTSLGDVLVDGDGLTLYMFTDDSAGTSACNGDCAAAWPPLTGDAAAAGDGLDDSKFSVITRDDGSSQLAYFGMPLYTFASDTTAGDVTGQGVGGKWYVLDAAGTVIK